MAKRTIHECDLTKQEMDPEDSFVLVLKKRGKRTKGSEFEISASSAELLLQQLNSNYRLPQGWSFATIKRPVNIPPDSLEDIEVEDLQPLQTAPEVRADLQREPTDEELAGEPERWEVARAENRDTSHTISGPETVAPEGDECIHMNKGRVHLGMKGGRRDAYRLCKDCGAKVPELRQQTRSRLTNVSAPDGTRVGHNVTKETRDRK
jgi:hypothetical protein